MNFHLPKPPDGWNRVAWDLAIVTVGVLIALAAQQAVDAWEWRQRVQIVRQSLMGELANDRARWDYDLAGAKCALSEIGQIDSGARGEATISAPSFPFIRSSQIMTMHTTNWTVAAGGEALDHFPVREQLAFAGLYAGISNRQVSIAQASDAMDRVQTLMPLASDPNARRELRETLGDLRTAAASIVDNEGYMQRHFDALHVKSDWSDFAADVRLRGDACAS
jgi:hypothetical protein